MNARSAGWPRCGAVSHRLTTVTLSGRVVVDTFDAKEKAGEASARKPKMLKSAVADQQDPCREV